MPASRSNVSAVMPSVQFTPCVERTTFGEHPGVTGLAVAGREMAVIGRRGALTPLVDTAAPAARVAMQRTVSCASDWGKPRSALDGTLPPHCGGIEELGNPDATVEESAW
jgi:hypothetical protein